MVKRFAPAAERNREPILEVLRGTLPERGLVLEVASGSGQHAVAFARAFPELEIQPSDADSGAIESIARYRFEAELPNLKPPVVLDAASDTWPLERADAIVSINMLHISPWEAGAGLLRGAARLLPQGGPLVLYGPFVVDGDFIAESNVAFDAELRGRDPRWGLREVRHVERAANEAGFSLEALAPRPANNHMLVFRRVSDGGFAPVRQSG
jgi:SAM-dependent methyltransferase